MADESEQCLRTKLLRVPQLMSCKEPHSTVSPTSSDKLRRYVDIVVLGLAIVSSLLLIVHVRTNLSNHDLQLSAFSTKTAYKNCGLKDFVNSNTRRLSQCQLIHITALYRHGTRSASKKDVKTFKQLFERLSESFRQGGHLPEGFLDYPVPFDDGLPEKRLLPAGYQELHDLGQLTRQKGIESGFTFSVQNTEFYSSSVSRALNSGMAFYNGLYDWPAFFNMQNCTSASQEQHCLPPGYTRYDQYVEDRDKRFSINNSLVRFFDHCPQYDIRVAENKTSTFEATAFKQGPVLGQALEAFVERWKLVGIFTVDDLYSVFLACGYEVATTKSPDEDVSPWCRLLSPEHQVALEYLSDLKQYWKNAYGYEVNHLQSCPLVSEVFQRLEKAALQYREAGFQPSTSMLHGSFWFGHAETILPVIARLGLFNDSHVLTADAGYSRRLGQLAQDPTPPDMFRSGNIAPFAGNIAFNLYYCPDEVDKGDADPLSGFLVEPLVNGRTVAWPLAGRDPLIHDKTPGTALRQILNSFNLCNHGVFNEKSVCGLTS